MTKIGRLKANTWTYLKKYWTCKMNHFQNNTLRKTICPGCLKYINVDNMKTIKLVKDGLKIKKEYIQHTNCGIILCLVR